MYEGTRAPFDSEQVSTHNRNTLKRITARRPAATVIASNERADTEKGEKKMRIGAKVVERESRNTGDM